MWVVQTLMCKCLLTLKSHAYVQSGNETYLALVSEVALPEAVLSNSGWGGREVEEKGRVPLDDTAFSSMSATAVWS